MLERIYQMICESKVLCGAEIWGIERGWGNSGGGTGKILQETVKNPS
jgi:hypothetical protein